MSDQASKKLCPKCKTEVDPKATKCPHCQSDLRNWFRKHPFLVLLIVIITVPFFSSQFISQPTSEVSPQEKIFNLKKNAIESFARSYVKDTLKSPTTAKFNYFPSIKEDSSKPNSFEIISDVTSQNSYGATLTSPWSIKVHYIGTDTEESINEGSNWQIDEFYFDGKKIK